MIKIKYFNSKSQNFYDHVNFSKIFSYFYENINYQIVTKICNFYEITYKENSRKIFNIIKILGKYDCHKHLILRNFYENL